MLLKHTFILTWKNEIPNENSLSVSLHLVGVDVVGSTFEVNSQHTMQVSHFLTFESSDRESMF